jgi:hypothetical protein
MTAKKNSSLASFLIAALMLTLAVLAGAGIASVLTGCATPRILTPPKGPGTEWPCGYDDVLVLGRCRSYDEVVPGPR